MRLPRASYELHRRARGVRPVAPTGRTTERYTRPPATVPGTISPAERDRRRAAGRRARAARRYPTQAPRPGGSKIPRKGAAHVGRRIH